MNEMEARWLSIAEIRKYLGAATTPCTSGSTGMVSQNAIPSRKHLGGSLPLQVVFRDSGFVSDAVKINVEQIFKQMSPHTEVKAI
jgi:hypothetical protein